jgi:hypothetical protein
MEDLASIADLNNFSQLAIDPSDTAAAFLLKVASGMVRRYLQQDITAVAGDVEYCDPVAGGVLLSQLPVTSVSLVETTLDGATWTAADPSTYIVSRKLGMVSARAWSGVSWPSDPESWRVTYMHGFDDVPDELKGVVCGIAARAYSTPTGIDMERTGQRQVKYNLEAEGFTPMERLVLSMFRIPRVA